MLRKKQNISLSLMLSADTIEWIQRRQAENRARATGGEIEKRDQWSVQAFIRGVLEKEKAATHSVAASIDGQLAEQRID
jgi:hypothetical protein